MAERYDKLIGFQVIQKINLGNHVTYDSASNMLGGCPFTGEEVVIPQGFYDNDEPLPATIEYVKELNTTNCKIADLEVKTRLVEFIKHYNDDKAINRGLSYFSTKRQHVDRDSEEVLLHTESVKNVNRLINTFPEMNPHGALLSLYSESVDLYIQARHMEAEHHTTNVYQDLLNALALELMGLNSYTGEPTGWSFQTTLKKAMNKVRLAEMYISRVPYTKEVRGFRAAVYQVQSDLVDAKKLKDLNTIGSYLFRRVPPLPLLRRWWIYGCM